MLLRKLLILLLLIAGVGLAGGAYLTRKPVSLSINGEMRQLQTAAWSVAELLRSEGYVPGEDDRVSPPPETVLWGNETVVFQQAAWIVVRLDGEVRSWRSLESVPAQIFSQAGVSLQPGDLLLSQGNPVDPAAPLAYQPVRMFDVVRPAPLIFQEGEESRVVTSTAGLEESLWEEGIRRRAGDILEAAPPGDDGSPAQASLLRGQTVVVLHGDQKIELYTTAETVGEALADNGFALQGMDYSIPEETAPLPKDKIQIVQVEEEVLVEQEPLAFDTELQPAPDLDLDTQQVIQAGEYGLLARRVRVVYEDGREVERAVEAEWVAQPPKNRVVGYGTRVVMRTVDTPDGTIQYWRALNMWATSYYPAVTSNTTASGLPLRKGVAAIDRRYIPFYTRMYVPGYGEALAADVGGGVRGRMIDLGYSDDDYVSWHQWVTVYFLWPPPENIVWIIP
jgi:resuscitation-promoting factor RpfB